MQLADAVYDRGTIGDRERAPGTQVVLHVNDDQGAHDTANIVSGWRRPTITSGRISNGCS